MTTLTVEKLLGHSLPPYGPHTITAHLPGWQSAVGIRDGDKTLLSQLKSIYPRFTPWGHARELVMKLCGILSLPEGHFAFPFLEPGMFPFAQEYAYSQHRKEHRLTPGDLGYRIVDISEGNKTVRLYLVVFPLAKADGVALVWGNPGVGISTRLAEALLPAVDAGKVTPVPWDAGDDSQPLDLRNVPKPTELPEGGAHAKLRERIVGYWKRAAVTPEKADLVTTNDVLLFPTGMASIFRLHQALMRWRSGKVVPLGSIFHNTWHLHEEAPQGFKHFGRLERSGKALDEFEAYLEGEAQAGRKSVTYVFVEFPSNPIVVSADLKRLKSLADKFDFVLVVDDTIGSFCNIDLSSVADIVMSSITKSFSGYSDVMGGSLVLNPASPRYASFKPVLKELFSNEYFIADAEKMLSNNDDYLERSTILNRNALTLATFLEELKTKEPEYGISRVLYPTTSDTLDNYKAYMRKPTDEFTPGYGCLLSVDFHKKDDTRIFYDNLDVFIGPHLGAQQTLAVCFNELVLGKEKEVADYHGAYGARLEQIRVSVGLEPEEELKKAFQDALEKVKEAHKGADNAPAVPNDGAVVV